MRAAVHQTEPGTSVDGIGLLGGNRPKGSIAMPNYPLPACQDPRWAKPRPIRFGMSWPVDHAISRHGFGGWTEGLNGKSELNPLSRLNLSYDCQAARD